MNRAIAACLALACLLLTSAAADPAEQLQDPAKEARARHLFREFRCVVCQNESIDDSEADLAADVRRIVREQVAAGRSDAEVRAFLTARYGEFILLKPSLSQGNLALWLIPPGLFALAGLALFLQARKHKGSEAPLSEEEEARLAAIMGERTDVAFPPHKGPTNGPADDGKVT
ncbi:MAG: cytochrome c-type biogenesis protein [Caulobacteraceae bacterium]